jgi:hypothetical protein
MKLLGISLCAGTCLLAPVAVGCGASSQLQGSCTSGFVNHSVATLSQLQNDWKIAQQTLATHPIEMNPLGIDGAPYFDPPNPAAFDVEPGCQVEVKGMANALPFPSAGFATSASATGYAAGETTGSGPWTVLIVEPSATTFDDAAAQWEFQNVILESLGGYSMQGR